MKKTFLTGLATLLPIAVTLFIVLFVVDFVTAPFVGVVENLIQKHEINLGERHSILLLFISRIAVLVLFFLVVFILGIFGRRLIFSWFINLMHRLFYKIPIIKTIYKITREISSSILTKKKDALFKGTVIVPFPHKNTRALGLLSGSPPEEINSKKEGLQAVFIPTAPHPVSGFLIMYNQNEVQQTNIETEDLFKMLVSCGIYHPPKKDSDES